MPVCLAFTVDCKILKQQAAAAAAAYSSPKLGEASVVCLRRAFVAQSKRALHLSPQLLKLLVQDVFQFPVRFQLSYAKQEVLQGLHASI